ncbi:alpha/beta fold hydrolase [Nakamurella sp. GG22]
MSTDEGARAAARAAFAAAYDRLLQEWPGPSEVLDLPSPYGTTRVRASGPEGAPPLVLLHAYRASSAEWIKLVRQLGGDIRCYAVDVPGDAGGSTAGELAISTPDDLVRWIDGVLDGLGLGTAGFCGHSYGAWITLHYAQSRPGRVDRLILLDPTMTFGPLAPAYLLHAVPSLLRASSARTRSLIIWENNGATLDPDWLELATLAADGFGNAPTVPTKVPSPTALAAVDMPVTVVLAGRSRVHPVRRIARNASRRLPQARIEIIDGATHYGLPLSHPVQIAESIRTG